VATVLDLVWIVPALPLLGATTLLLVGKRIGEPRAGWIATGLMALSFAWAIVVFVALLDQGSDAHQSTLFTWLQVGAFRVEMGFLVDPLSTVWLLLVTGVGSLIHLYSIGYMRGDERFARYFAYLNLFAASMLVLVLGSSFLVTFLGWEGVGLCSYLLISFWFERDSAAVAGKKAFIANRVGDFGFMLGMFLLFATIGSLDYLVAGEAAPGLADGTATAIALLFFLGAVGKSAQFPLYPWLADAMEGPTPVSALIHAATMVTAGVFVMCRAAPLLDASPWAGDVVAWVGAFTALYAATIALVQTDIKKVLAYSTISQLGYMFLAVGVGAYSAAVFLMLMHAFFKATLFLGAGSVMHALDDDQDLRRMGALRAVMPITAVTFIVAWLAIAGIPPFAGFWAKDDVLANAWFAADYGVWALGVLAAVMTAFYMARETLLVFYGNRRWDDTKHPHESPWVMTVPLVVLGGLAAVGGFVNLPFTRLEFLGDWLEHSFEGAPDIHPTSFVAGASLSVVAVTMGVIGIAVAISLYRRGLPNPDRDPIDVRLGPVAPVLHHAWYYDETISRAVDGPIRRGATWLSDVFDAKIVDGAVNGVGTLAMWGASGLRRLQTGYVRNYAAAVLLGAVALIVLIMVRAT